MHSWIQHIWLLIFFSLDQAELASDDITLRNCLTLADPPHFRSSTLLPKVERYVIISGNFDVVKLLLVKDIGVNICGVVIGASRSSQESLL